MRTEDEQRQHDQRPPVVIGGSGGLAAWQGIIGLGIIGSATAAAWHGIVSGDALIGLYGTLLGYIFGTATNGGKRSKAPEEAAV